MLNLINFATASLWSFVLFFTLPTLAQMTPSSQPTKVVFTEDDIKEPGYNYVLIEKNGHELPKIEFDSAQQIYVITLNPQETEESKIHQVTIGVVENSKMFALPGKLTENTCDYRYNGSACNIRLEYGLKGFRVIWIKHPDHEKIGRPATGYANTINYINGEAKVSVEETPLIEIEGFTNKDTVVAGLKNNFKFSKKLLERLSYSRVICEKTGWFKQLAEEQGQKSLVVREWSNETMSQNPETNINENRTFSAAYNVNLKALNEEFLIEKIGLYPKSTDPFSIYTQTAHLFFGDVVGWSIVTPKRRCELSFNFTMDALLAFAGNLNSYLMTQVFQPAQFDSPEEFVQLGLSDFRNQTTVQALPKDFKIYGALGLLSFSSGTSKNIEFEKDGVKKTETVFYNTFQLRGVK